MGVVCKVCGGGGRGEGVGVGWDIHTKGALSPGPRNVLVGRMNPKVIGIVVMNFLRGLQTYSSE